MPQSTENEKHTNFEKQHFAAQTSTFISRDSRRKITKLFINVGNFSQLKVNNIRKNEYE